jgi:uncharacterized protein (TIGR02646 family)
VRSITKGVEPNSLTEHRARPFSDYDNYQEKDDLRAALVNEQCGLCCYCMSRIRGASAEMKIEHWRSQADYPGEQLVYRNLLGACDGGEGQPLRLQYCDTRKGNLGLKWNPANPDHQIETRVRYEADGMIRADDLEFDQQLNQVLNLNLPMLKNNRKSVLTALLDWWKENRPVPHERIEREILRRTANNGELPAYCQVAVWWLRKKLPE